MQYLSSFAGLTGPSTSNPNVFLFDSREEPNISVTNLTDANLLAKRARSVLGFNGFCNTVRGRKSNRYYFCPLRYTKPRADLIEASTDIVSQPSSGTLSGLTTVAETQSYSMGLGTDTTLFLTYGVKDISQLSDASIVFPPIALSDTNCPYGQSGTAVIGFRYVHDQGNQFTYTATISMGVPACKFSVGNPINSNPIIEFKLMQAAVSATVQGIGGYGTPSLSTSSTTGDFMYQRQAGLEDELLTLDRAMCYLKEFRAFITMDNTEFMPVSAVPGTRPKIQFKLSKLSI